VDGRQPEISSLTATWGIEPPPASAPAVNNTNFGGFNATTRYAEDAIHGFGRRGYNWDFTAEVQHQLRRAYR